MYKLPSSFLINYKSMLVITALFFIGMPALLAEDSDGQRARQMLESILKSAPTGIGVVKNRVIFEVNDYILNLTGYKREELLGNSARMLYPTQRDFEYVGQEKYRQIAASGTGSVETRWLRKDGAIRHVILSSTPLDQTDLSVGVTFTVLDITERKQAEERFTKAFISSPAALVISEIETGRFLDVNARWIEMLGYTKEEQIGRTSKEVGIWHDPRDRDRIVEKLHAHGHFTDEPIQFISKSGELRFAVWSAEVITIEGKQVLLSLLMDTTAQRRSEQSLIIRTIVFLSGISILFIALIFLLIRLSTSLRQQKAAAEELESFFTVNLDMLCIADFNGRLIKTNKAWSSILGYSAEELAKIEFLEFVHPDDLQKTRCAITDLGKGDDVLNFINRYRTVDGSYRYIEWRSHPNGNLIYAAARDITDRIHNEETLRASEERLRTTLFSIGDAVITTDAHSLVTGMNPVAEKLTGWKAGEATGNPLTAVFNIVNASTRQTVENPVARVLETGEIIGLANHTVLISRDGKEFQIADSAAPIRMSSGDTFGVVLVFRDVTEEYALQDRMNQSQKMESIGQLAGGIAHDFNNMLGGIIGGTELMQRCLDSNKDPRPHLKLILQSAERAAELTSKLLTFARKQQVAFSIIDVLLPLREAISLLTSTADKRIVVQAMLPDNEIPIVGDPAQLQSAFLNLLINATHAMPEGGNIYMSARVQELDATFCNARGRDIVPGQYAEIEIRDTGCGMPQEMISRIFEPFFTTKEQGKGTGLGLAVVHGAVTQHKGFVTVYSEVGTGTSFHIFLPLADSCVKGAPETFIRPVRGSGTILLVDDEAVMRATASSILQDLGYEVLLAENGAEALACYKREKERIDLVILDMIMPQMNGRDCFLAMKKISPNMRAILSSGFSREEEIEPMKEAGLRGFVHKPYSIATLSKVVRAALCDDDVDKPL